MEGSTSRLPLQDVTPAAVEGQLRGHAQLTALMLETSCKRERREERSQRCTSTGMGTGEHPLPARGRGRMGAPTAEPPPSLSVTTPGPGSTFLPRADPQPSRSAEPGMKTQRRCHFMLHRGTTNSLTLCCIVTAKWFCRNISALERSCCCLWSSSLCLSPCLQKVAKRAWRPAVPGSPWGAPASPRGQSRELLRCFQEGTTPAVHTLHPHPTRPRRSIASPAVGSLLCPRHWGKLIPARGCLRLPSDRRSCPAPLARPELCPSRLPREGGQRAGPVERRQRLTQSTLF